MYLTILPLTISGILNMVFTKTKLYQKHKSPIDRGRVLKDGKRIFGDNKTWIGFISMVLISTCVHAASGVVVNMLNISHCSDLYSVYDNTILYNSFVGFMFGLIYMLSELPNSFIKRRLDIKAGKTDKGIKGLVFFIIDQIDSLVGVSLLIFLLSNITLWKSVGYVALGAITHITVNLVLYLLKVRKNL
jgi:CDP-diglyceride synthetase